MGIVVWQDGFDDYPGVTGVAGGASEVYVVAQGTITNSTTTRFTYGQGIQSPILVKELNGTTGYDVVTTGFAAYLNGDGGYPYNSADAILWQLTDASNDILASVVYDGQTNRVWFLDSTATTVSTAASGDGAHGGYGSDAGTMSYWVVPNLATWYWFDITWGKGTSANTGVFSCNVEGLNMINKSNVNMGTTNAVQWATGVYIAVGNPWIIDDLYIRNDNVMLGDSREVELEPTSDYSVGWTPNTGASNYLMVNEQFADGDNSVVYAANAGATDLFNVNNIASLALTYTPTVFHSVKVATLVRKDAAPGNRVLENLIQSNGVVANGALNAPSQSYQVFSDVFTNDPNTGGAWTAASIANAKIGFKIVS